MLHRGKQVWGEEPERFDPNRFSPERRGKIPPNAYKPFGTGQRACIGRQFALQEATLVLGMLLQRFVLVGHLDYQLHTKTTLTIKPDEFSIQVLPRTDVRIDRPGPRIADVVPSPRPAPSPVTALPVARHGTRLSVLFGSNLGTAEALATRLAQEGTE